VSSKDQERGYSIAAQIELLSEYAQRHGFVIAEKFIDVETAKASGRTAFNEMLSYLKKHRASCRTILVEKTDRLYRNWKDPVLVDELDLELHFVKENAVICKDSRSTDKLVHGLHIVLAKNYVDNLSEEVKKGLCTKAAQGLYPSYAPPGYTNVLGPDGKRIIVPDPVLGPMVTQIFGWFATGEYSLVALAQKAYEEGFRFRKSRSKVPVTTLHKILRRRIYVGEFEYAGNIYQGRHEPLMEREVWDRCQEILDGRHLKKHRKVTHDFAFSGFVSCGHCGCSIVGEVKKKRYVYYHCTGYRGKCGEPYTREERLLDQFAQGLSDLIIPPQVLEWLQHELVSSDVSERAAGEQALRRYQAELQRVRDRLDVLYEDRLDRRIDCTMYDQKAAEIQEQQRRLEDKIAESQVALPSVEKAIDLMGLTSKAA
jgi:DNA invertase Pin-like site-specific DNA recombinase